MSYTHQLKKISGVDGFLENPTCFNDKVCAMVGDNYYNFVMQIDIVVKHKEVVISLLPFVQMPCPSFNRCPSNNCCSEMYPFLKGYGTELFYIEVGFKDETKKTIGDVYLFKLDVTRMIWEEMEDLKDAIFFMELTNPFDDHAGSKKEQSDSDAEIVVRPVKGDEIEFEGESLLSDIPFPLLEIIMELCIGVEYMNFCATSKHCHVAAPPIQWRSKTTLKRLQMYSLVSPWLMVWDKNRGIITFIDPICRDKYFIKTPQELSGDYQIYYSRYGWMLMYKIDGPLVFFNPFTGDIRELPQAPYLENFCFSSTPTSPDCMVVGYSATYEGCVYIHFVSREPSWRHFVMNIDSNNPYYFYFPTYDGRDLYALRNGGVEVFREIREDFSREHVAVKDPKS